jgi:CoA:oxalate CoA-transferase
MLCDLGADVIKVEPPDGDMTRFSAPRRHGLSSYFVQQNVGKRNISLDLTTTDGLQVVLELADRADILIENFRPGVLDKLGLGWEVLSARSPRLIVGSISGYGQDGPWTRRRAYAPVVGAESGFTHSQGVARAEATGEPAMFANDQHSHADVYTSLEACAGILAALYQRERTGRGDRVDISMAQTMLYVNEHGHDALWDGDVDPAAIRSFRPGDYPVLTAANGESIVVSGHPAERGTFELYMRGIDRAELIDEPRFADVAGRRAALPELHEILRRWAASMPSADAVEEALSRFRLASGRLRTYRDVCDSDWGVARNVTVEVPDRGVDAVAGTVRIPNSPWHFAGSDVSVRGEPRYRGEDNSSVLIEELGYTAEQVAELTAAGVLSSRLPSR